MNKELEDKLIEEFPIILKDCNGNINTTCMAFGIECDDGWFDLLRSLMKRLQWMTDKNGYPQVIADQIKEKYGTLHFYYSTEYTNTVDEFSKRYQDGYISACVECAEDESGRTCERCGSTTDITRTTGWITTICKICLDKKTGEHNEN